MSDVLDPTMQNLIPAAVRRQSARADALAREASAAAGAPPAPGATTVEGAPPVEGTTTVAPPAPAPAPAPVPAPAPEPASDWQQKYSSLKGKYDSEVPALRAQVRTLDETVTRLHGTIASMNMAKREAPPPASAAGPSPEDVAEYGAELIDKSRKWARAEIMPEIETLRNQLGELKGTTQNVVARTAEERVFNALDAAVPNWRVLNDDPGFMFWLSNVDDFSGQQRQALLGEAYTKGDAARTVAFFKAYVAEQTATGASGTTTAHTPPGGAGTVPLESLAAPGRGSPAAPGAPADKRMWTNAQIAAHYSDVTRGKYRDNPAAAARIEADIFAAASEGRIR